MVWRPISKSLETHLDDDERAEREDLIATAREALSIMVSNRMMFLLNSLFDSGRLSWDERRVAVALLFDKVQLPAIQSNLFPFRGTYIEKTNFRKKPSKSKIMFDEREPLTRIEFENHPVWKPTKQEIREHEERFTTKNQRNTLVTLGHREIVYLKEFTRKLDDIKWEEPPHSELSSHQFVEIPQADIAAALNLKPKWVSQMINGQVRSSGHQGGLWKKLYKYIDMDDELQVILLALKALCGDNPDVSLAYQILAPDPTFRNLYSIKKGQ